MPLPSARPISGSRCGPNRTSAATARTIRWEGMRKPSATMSQRSPTHARGIWVALPIDAHGEQDGTFRCMSSSEGFQLITPSGDRIGKVCAETDDGYVVATGGPLRRTFHVLPKEHAWPDTSNKSLRLTVPRQRLFASPVA